MSSQFKENLLKLAKEVDSVCRWVRTAHFVSAGIWDVIGLFLGVSAIVVGVAGGGSAGAGIFGPANPALAAVLSATAGLTAGVVSFLKPSDRASAHKKAGDDWSILRDKVVSFWQLEIVLETDELKLEKKYDDLLKEKEDITRKSPIFSNWVFGWAKQVLRKRDEAEKKKQGAESATAPV
ncbi:MAG: hypothetical protein AUI21_03590 [Nitrospirae bacterium 13_1_40CM_2_62_10]|nr:MAG: hypothetical protein AUI21_03590 [Nitrospirae bacterium 13_1_40CM_2_62_10]